MNKEEFENIINKIKENVDETTSALISEDLLALVSAFNGAVDSVQEITDKMTKLEADKDELLKVNGRLFQKIGFDKEESEEENKKENNVKDEEEISIEDVIDEKGDLI